MSTMKDLARHAGVSVGTVSNYFNNPGLLSKDTYDAIKQAIIDLNYHPHAAARSLKSRLTKRIGFIPLISIEENLSLLPSDFAFWDVVAAANTKAAEHGYSVLLHSVTNPKDEIAAYEQLIGEKQVDGVILMGTTVKDPRIEFLSEKGYPFVCFGQTESKAKYAFIDVDGEKGIGEAVDYLVGLGHHQIAYLTPPKGLMCERFRWKGFYGAMQRREIKILDEFIVRSGFTESEGLASMNKLLDLPNRPTAILTANDLCAFGAMRAMQLRGLTPGRDISVIGFDDIPLAENWHPALTTVVQPFRKIGYLLTDMLIDQINGEAREDISVMIEPILVVRESTGNIR